MNRLVTTFFKILNLLNTKQRKEAFFLLIMVVIMAIIETVSVFSLLPFLSVLSNKSLIETNYFLSNAFKFVTQFGVVDIESFEIIMGVCVLVMIISSAIFKSFTNHSLNQFIEYNRHTLGIRLFEIYIKQPYIFFAKRNTNEMSKTILSEIDQIMMHVIRPVFLMLSSFIVLIGLFGLLLIINFWIVLFAILIFSICYGSIFILFKKRISNLGEKLVDSNTKRFLSIGETFNSIKVVKSLQKEDLFLNNFKSPSINYAKTVASHQTLNEIPNTIVETVILGNVVLSALFIIYINYSNSNNSNILNYLPTLGLFIYAFFRVKPYLQSVYSGISGLRYGILAIDNLHKEFLLVKSSNSEIYDSKLKITFNEAIKFKNISYSYPGSNNRVLKNLNLKIEKGSMVGFVGSTGAGKTTLIDLLLGLLSPISGSILVDNQLLTKNEFSNFRNQIGYVPQDIYMMDSTIAKNIAFCFDTENIDFERIIYCAKLAQIDEFIQSLPLKYETNIGERGIQISGGQRQRIGIARALYSDAPILLLDEATSALDNITERQLMNSINQLAPKKTIILIAHRITTLIKCDKIFIIEKGVIVDSGTYDYLKTTSSTFKNMLK